MKQENKPFGIRGDLHSRLGISREHIAQVDIGVYAGIIDVGDVEVAYIDKDHPLRANQDIATESTMDAIIRNALDSHGALTAIGESAVQNTLRSVEKMHNHLDEALMCAHPLRVIAGNAVETWTKIFGTIATSNQQEVLRALFDRYTMVQKEASTEFYAQGKLHAALTISTLGLEPSSAFLYLPWKASMDSVTAAISTLKTQDVHEIAVFSHDYLTKGSIPAHYQDGMRPMQNEEQVVTTLDALAEHDADVKLFFGHIGFEYDPFEIDFEHAGKRFSAYHVDEAEGSLLMYSPK